MLSQILKLKGVALITKKQQQFISGGIEESCDEVAACSMEGYEAYYGCIESAKEYNSQYKSFKSRCLSYRARNEE